MADLPELILFRHGQTEWNLQGRWQGAMDSPLTPQGVAQAQALGTMLGRLGYGAPRYKIISSPQPRASMTAQLAFGFAPPTDARLREIEVGDWTGQEVATLRQKPGIGPQATFLELYDAAPGAEGVDALETRCRAMLDELDGPTILVTHGMTALMLRALAIGLPRSAISGLSAAQGTAFRIVRQQEEHLIPIPEDWPRSPS